MPLSKLLKRTFRFLSIAFVPILFLLILFNIDAAYSAFLSEGSLFLSDSRPSQEDVTYQFEWSDVTDTTARCIEITFSTDFEDTVLPTDMDSTSASFSSSSTMTPTPASWSLNATTNGLLVLTNATGESLVDGTLIFEGIDNSSFTTAEIFGLINTYDDVACTNRIDFGAIAFVLTDGQLVTMTVVPQLTFTIEGVELGQGINGALSTVTTETGTNLVEFGVLSTVDNQIAAHSLNISTNALFGYTVFVKYTGPLSYMTAQIDDHTGTNAAPTAFPAAGVEAFGYTTDSFDENTWAGFTTEFEPISTASGPQDDTFGFGYQVGIGSLTPAGTYSTTVVFQATPTY